MTLRRGGHGPHHPSSQNTTEDDAEDLLYNFTSETLRRNRLARPDDNVIHQG